MMIMKVMTETFVSSRE